MSSTMLRASQPTSDACPSRLDPGIVANLAASVNLTAPLRDDLCRRVAAGELPVGTALEELFIKRFGKGRPRAELLRFLFVAAPRVRRIVVAAVDANGSFGATGIGVAAVKSWLWWLDATDPLCARMVDLHYFAGLSIKETAAVLRLPPAAVVRQLRFARSWLCIEEPSDGLPG